MLGGTGNTSVVVTEMELVSGFDWLTIPLCIAALFIAVDRPTEHNKKLGSRYSSFQCSLDLRSAADRHFEQDCGVSIIQ